MTVSRTVYALKLTALILLLVSIGLACNGGAKGTLYQEKKGIAFIEVQASDDGKIQHISFNTDKTTDTTGNVNIQAPPGAKDGSTFVMGDNGLTAGVGSTYAPVAIDYVKRNEGNLIYVGIGIALLGLIVMVLPWTRLIGLSSIGLPLIIFGGAVACAPTVLNYAGPWLAALLVICAVGAVVFGVAWFFAHRSGRATQKGETDARINVTAGALVASGKSEVATLLRRVTNPSYNASYTAQKAATATESAMAGDPLAGPAEAAVVPITPAGGTPTGVTTVPPPPSL